MRGVRPTLKAAPHPPAGTFSPQAGRRDKRRQLNPAFTARPRERVGAAYPFSRLRGEGGGSRLRGNPDRAGLRRLGSRGIPFMSSIRRTGAQEICACRSVLTGRRDMRVPPCAPLRPSYAPSTMERGLGFCGLSLRPAAGRRCRQADEGRSSVLTSNPQFVARSILMSPSSSMRTVQDSGSVAPASVFR